MLTVLDAAARFAVVASRAGRLVRAGRCAGLPGRTTGHRARGNPRGVRRTPVRPPRFSSAGRQPAIRNGDLALTSTRLPGGGATVEVARRQPDGSWRWVIDQPAVLP